MIKCILFDLDGVLISAKEVHYKALNEAILDVTGNERWVITPEDHLSIFDGRKTTDKLDILTRARGLPSHCHTDIWKVKQKKTAEYLGEIEPDANITDTITKLYSDGYILGCCSNSIWETVDTILNKLEVYEYMNIIVSNDKIRNSKPHPEMYWNAMSAVRVFPQETLIIEDSPIGLKAAFSSGASVMRVSGPSDVTIENINRYLENGSSQLTPRWAGNTMNILIPMAGAGSRFQAAGYTFPKPLIDVKGKPMIQVVTENLGIDANYIYVVQKEHRAKYNLDTLLNLISPGCKIVEVDGITEGAACTTLLAKDLIDNNDPLIIANSDQFVEWDSIEFMYKMTEHNADGGIVTFTATHPKWSFAKTDGYGYVTQVAEKNPISDKATVGIYYWKHGSDYVKYAEQMIEKNIRVNNEFYVCPVFNEAIEDGKKIKTFDAQKMWGLGTPEDLNYYLTEFDK